MAFLSYPFIFFFFFHSFSFFPDQRTICGFLTAKRMTSWKGSPWLSFSSPPLSMTRITFTTTFSSSLSSCQMSLKVGGSCYFNIFCLLNFLFCLNFFLIIPFFFFFLLSSTPHLSLTTSFAGLRRIAHLPVRLPRGGKCGRRHLPVDAPLRDGSIIFLGRQSFRRSRR